MRPTALGTCHRELAGSRRRRDDKSYHGNRLATATVAGEAAQLPTSSRGHELQGATLDSAQLQGAALRGAQLQGASLDSAQLQGASLDKAQLRGVSFDHVFVWRADARQAIAEGARVIKPETDSKYRAFDCTADQCDWSQETFTALQGQIRELVPQGTFYLRDVALQGIAILEPAKQIDEQDMAKRWDELARSSPPDDVYLKTLAEQWREIGCSAVGAPYVAHGLLKHSTYALSLSAFRSKLLEALSRAFLDENHCPGVHGLSEEDRAELRKIRDTAVSPQLGSAPATPRQ